MPLTKQQKKERVEQVEQSLSQATSSAFIAFNGVTMEEMEQLRDNLFAQGCRMRVIPKRLLRLALERAKLEFEPMEEEGQIAVVWGDDPVAPAKTLHEFAKEHEHVRLVAGVLDKSMLSAEEITALAKLPSQDQLRGQLVSVLAGPTRGFVSVLAGVPRSLVYALFAIQEEKS